MCCVHISLNISDCFSELLSVCILHVFRLILTMDPHHGELSRALRNRGIEICILGEVNLYFVKTCYIPVILAINSCCCIPCHKNCGVQFMLRTPVYGSSQ